MKISPLYLVLARVSGAKASLGAIIELNAEAQGNRVWRNYRMDYDYRDEEQRSLSPQEQENIKVLGRFAGGLIVSAWIFLGALTLICCCVSLLACINYGRIRRLKRKVSDQEVGISKTDKQF